MVWIVNALQSSQDIAKILIFFIVDSLYLIIKHLSIYVWYIFTRRFHVTICHSAESLRWAYR